MRTLHAAPFLSFCHSDPERSRRGGICYLVGWQVKVCGNSFNQKN